MHGFRPNTWRGVSFVLSIAMVIAIVAGFTTLAVAKPAPIVRITSPEHKTATNADELQVGIEFETSAGKPTSNRSTGNVQQVLLLVDGAVAAISINSPSEKNGDRKFTIDVSTLPEGYIELVALAYQANSRANLEGSSDPVMVLIDRTPPAISASIDPHPNAAGWNNSPVLVTFSATDSGAGLTFITAPVLVNAEGANQPVIGEAVDAAVNTSSLTVYVNVDLTPPTFDIADPADGASTFNENLLVRGTVSDAISGLAEITCNGVLATLTGDQFECSVILEGGPNIIEIVAIDAAGNSATDSITVTRVVDTVPGVLLAGDPSALAMSAYVDTPVLAAPRDEITENGVILSRMDAWFHPDATVAEVNDALSTIGARIVTMDENDPAVTLAVPLQPSADALAALAVTIESHSAVLFAMPGFELQAKRRPPGVSADDAAWVLDTLHLFPTRFPAAWNALSLAETNCATSTVQILIADTFDNSVRPANFNTQVPNFSIINPVGGSPDPGATHGFDVAGTIAALFDPDLPTGANPLPGCINFTALNMIGTTFSQDVKFLADNMPSGQFVMNLSLGYGSDQVNCSTFTCPPGDYTSKLTSPYARAFIAGKYKDQTRFRWQDYLAAVSAGNEANKAATTFYPGLGESDWDNYIALAATTDPLFGGIQDSSLWNPAPIALPSLVATSDQRDNLTVYLNSIGVDAIFADNVLSVGAATAGVDAEATHLSLDEAAFSDRHPDVKAVGESVTVISNPGGRNGTSFASPQVAGLAAYLMMLDPTMTPADAKRAIDENTKTGLTTDIIDAFDAALSLDANDQPTFVNSPVRSAVLDVNDDGLFTAADIANFLNALIDPATGEPFEIVEDRTWGRRDLNGDGYVGGFGTVPFDLDRLGSTQYGAPLITPVVARDTTGSVALFDEAAVTDMDVLCFYSYSTLFVGPPEDLELRSTLLEPFCNFTTRSLTITLESVPDVVVARDGITIDGTVIETDLRSGVSIPAAFQLIEVESIIFNGTGRVTTNSEGKFSMRHPAPEGMGSVTFEFTARVSPDDPEPATASASIEIARRVKGSYRATNEFGREFDLFVGQIGNFISGAMVGALNCDFSFEGSLAGTEITADAVQWLGRCFDFGFPPPVIFILMTAEDDGSLTGVFVQTVNGDVRDPVAFATF